MQKQALKLEATACELPGNASGNEIGSTVLGIVTIDLKDLFKVSPKPPVAYVYHIFHQAHGYRKNTAWNG